MTRLSRALALAGALSLVLVSSATAQLYPSGSIQGNATASAAPPRAITPSAWFDRWCGSTAGFMPIRGASSWGCAAAGSGSGFQAWDADLDALAAFSSTGFAARTASNTWAQRTLTAPAAGFTITNPAGVAGDPTFVLANDLAALEAMSGTGLVARTASETYAQRTLTAPAAGITVTNADGVSGNPTLVLANDLLALEGLSSTGFAARTTTDTWAQRTVTGTAAEITVTNGDGVSGNPTLSLPSALTFTGKTVTGGTFAFGGANSWVTGLGAINHLSGPTDQPFALVAPAPVQAASTVAGNAFNLTAGAATAGSSNAGAAAGGAVTVTAGAAARLTSGNAAGGAVTLTAGASTGSSAAGAVNLNAGSATVNTGSGGAVNLTAGNALTTGTGGAVVIVGGASASSSAASGAGGAVAITSGAAAATSGAGLQPSASGAASLVSGAGANATAATGGTGSNTGGVTISTGAAGSATGGSGTRTGGNSGDITIGTGAPGTGASANGAAGKVQVAIGGTNIWNVNPSGHTIWNTDNTYDIGASGATRPRNVYIGGTLNVAGAIPSPTFSGTVAGANTVPLTILAQSAANTMLGNWTGSTANVTANAMPSCADTGGNHLNYVAGTGITCGTSSSGGGSGGTATAPQGRLTLVTATPVMTTTQSAKTTIYYTPYAGVYAPIFDGVNTTMHSTGGEMSIALGSNWAANTLFDVYIGLDSSTVRMCTGAAWTNDTTRAESHAYQNGFLVNAASMTCRYNNTTTFTCAQFQCTYVGSFYTNGSTGTVDFIYGTTASGGGAASLGVCNYYNKVHISTRVRDNGTAYTYTSGTQRQARASAGNQVSFISCYAEEVAFISYGSTGSTVAGAGAQMNIYVGQDSTSTSVCSLGIVYAPTAAVNRNSPSVVCNWISVPPGKHFTSMNEGGDGTNANTFNYNENGTLNFVYPL